jgi:WD40 repeat protein
MNDIQDVYDLSLSHTGHLLAIVESDGIHFHGVADDKHTTLEAGVRNKIKSGSFSSADELFAFGSDDYSIRFWQDEGHGRRAALYGHSSVKTDIVFTTTRNGLLP